MIRSICSPSYHRVDLGHASSNLSRPRLGMHRTISPVLTVQGEESFNALVDSEWGPGLPGEPITLYEGMDPLQARIFHRLKQLSLLTLAVDKPHPNPALQTTFTNGIIILEHQVCSSTWSVGLNQIRQHGSATRHRAPAANRACARTWHITIVIYLYAVLRLLPPSAQCLVKLVTRCKISLERCSPTELWCHFPQRFLLWVLLIAGSTSTESERAWFGVLLVELRKRMQLPSWKDAKTIVQEYVWVESRCGKPCKAFWDETTASMPRHHQVLAPIGQH
jgi:hypothetical protein